MLENRVMAKMFESHHMTLQYLTPLTIQRWRNVLIRVIETGEMRAGVSV